MNASPTQMVGDLGDGEPVGKSANLFEIISVEGVARPDIHAETVQQEGMPLTESLELAKL